MRLAPLVLLFGLLSRCGGAGAVEAHVTPLPPHRLPARTVILRPGAQQTFRSGALHAGDVVTCFVAGGTVRLRVPAHPSGGWSVGKGVATPKGASGGLELRSNADGTMTATCRR